MWGNSFFGVLDHSYGLFYDVDVKKWWWAVPLIAAIFWFGCWAENKIRNRVLPPTENRIETFRVKRVIDGDTIELTNGEKVRYIGINAPEMKNRKGVRECFAEEAKDKNIELVADKEVVLEKDVSERDKYGRWLRYVYLNGKMVNQELVGQGYAQIDTYPPDVKYQKIFLSAEKSARANGFGLWNNDKCDYNQKN